LTRIAPDAFYESSLQLILIPKNVEIFGSKRFSSCGSLSSIFRDMIGWRLVRRMTNHLSKSLAASSLTLPRPHEIRKRKESYSTRRLDIVKHAIFQVSSDAAILTSNCSEEIPSGEIIACLRK
jgi:hypothetical protein